MIRNNSPCEIDQPQSSMMAMLQACARQDCIPLSGTFELTPRCNFNCRMCYVHLKENQIPKFGAELSVEEWIRLAEEARNAGMLYLCITGGEPLMYRGFEVFYRAVARMGFQITLQTNASLLRGSVLKLLEEYPPSLAKITVYGSNDEVYRNVCGISKGFQNSDAGIRALQKLGIPVLLVTTVIKQNKEDLPRIAAYANSLRLPWIYTASVQPSARGAESEEASFLEESDYPNFKEDFERMLALPRRRPDDQPCEYCKGNHMSFWITWNGEMRFCSYMNEPHIPVRDRPFAASWQELIDYEGQLQWPEECRTCDIRAYCHLCAGALAARSGSVHQVDPQYCAQLRQRIALYHKKLQTD